MTIEASLAALYSAKTDIASAITYKGGIVNEGDGFDDFSDAIRLIPATAIPSEYGLVTFTALDPLAAVIKIT